MEQDDKRLVMTEQAWAWYTNPLSLGNGRPRNWLPLKKLALVAEAMGRSITLNELQILVQKDGPMQKCVGCGKGFQPVKMVAINQWLLDQLSSGQDLSTLEELRWVVGSFILSRGKDHRMVSLGFCGSLFYFDPKVKDTDDCEIFSINKQTCLGNAYLSKENRDQKGDPRRTRSVESGEAIVEADEERLAENERLYRENQKRIAKEKREHKITGVQHAFAKAGVRT